MNTIQYTINPSAQKIENTEEEDDLRSLSTPSKDSTLDNNIFATSRGKITPLKPLIKQEIKTTCNSNLSTVRILNFLKKN